MNHQVGAKTLNSIIEEYNKINRNSFNRHWMLRLWSFTRNWFKYYKIINYLFSNGYEVIKQTEDDIYLKLRNG